MNEMQAVTEVIAAPGAMLKQRQRALFYFGFAVVMLLMLNRSLAQAVPASACCTGAPTRH